MPLLDLLTKSSALRLCQSPDIDRFRRIENLSEAQSIPLDLSQFDTAFAEVALKYIDETFPDPPLMPKDPAERARMRLWSKFVDEGLFDGATELSFSAMFRERMRNMPAELREKRFATSAIRAGPTASNRPTSTACNRRSCCTPIAAYERAFKLMEQTLAERGPWMLGAQPTLADINLMPFAARLAYLGLLEAWTDDRPRINAMVAAGAGMAELQTRIARPDLRGRIRRDAHPRPENPPRPVAARLAGLRGS